MSSVILARSAIVWIRCMRKFVCDFLYVLCVCVIQVVFVCVNLYVSGYYMGMLYATFCMCQLYVSRYVLYCFCVCQRKSRVFYYYQIALRPSLSLSALGTYHRAYSCLKVLLTMCLCGYYLCTVGDISLELCSIGFVCIFVCITVCIGFLTCTVCQCVCQCVT